SVEELRNRLVSRSTDSAEVIEKRIAKAEYELTFASQFDCIIINELLEIAFAEAEKCIREFIASSKQQAAKS
ncbi:MAG: hypothetical protein Q7J86_12075, partial [Bacteroidota bacterium]|nr:hypothetical protein [Bacteroidota bacterium]